MWRTLRVRSIKYSEWLPRVGYARNNWEYMATFNITVDNREKRHMRSYQIIIDTALIKREQGRLAPRITNKCVLQTGDEGVEVTSRNHSGPPIYRKKD